MTKYYGDTNFSGRSVDPKKRRHKNPWWTVLKVCCWTIGSLAVLCGIAIWIISYQFTPGHIKKMIEEKAGEYLDAKVEIGKLDYKLFSTYPWFEFEIDTLNVISKSLEKLSPQQLTSLPSNADSLFSVVKLKGKLNVHDLIHQRINAKELEIAQPNVNLVIYDDSISNFNILKSKPQMPDRMPEIDLSELKVESPMLLSFFSLPLQAQGNVNVENFFLTGNPDKSYGIGFEGEVSGRYQDFSLPGIIPVKFSTQLTPRFPDLALSVSQLMFGIYDIELIASGQIDISSKGIEVKPQSDVSFKTEDIFKTLSLLPPVIADRIQIPDGITGVLPLEVKTILQEPYNLQYGATEISIPTLQCLINIPDASLRFTPPGMKALVADNLFLNLNGTYNPYYLSQNAAELNLGMTGEGLEIRGQVFINQTDSLSQSVTGNIHLGSQVMETLSYFISHPAMKLAGHLDSDLAFSMTTIDYGKDGIQDIKLSGNLNSRSLKVKGSAGEAVLRNMKSNFKAGVPAYPLKDYKGTKLFFTVSTDSLATLANGTRISASKLEIDLDAMDTVSGNPDPNGVIRVKAKSLMAKNGATDLKAENIDLVTNGALSSSGNNYNSNYPTYQPKALTDDALIESRIKHTPLALVYEGGGILSTVMGMVNLDSELKIGSGSFRNSSYLYPISFRGLDLSTNLNRVNFYASEIKIGNSGLTITGEIDGLEPFLTSYSATPLKATADINFTNVDINQLSWGYYGALKSQGKDSVYYVAPMLPYTASDSVCVLIPRNLDADIRLRSNSAEYMQYRFSPLSTDITVKNGVATLGKLTVGAPYCKAVVDWTYSTASLDNIFMDLKAKVENFSFSPFYEVFPELVENAPELKNFTGNINADVDCRFLMYPDMFMNPQSLTGKFDIKGTNMQFARQGKIERITHLMLIEGDAPIKLHNLNVTGAYHDNLLQINPFNIAFDGYELQVGGVNNTAGKMYYHLALLKSPFHLPFGVSLVGNMKHPEVRIGGTHIDDFRSEMVEDDETNRINANILTYLHHGWLLFVTEAAKFYEDKGR